MMRLRYLVPVLGLVTSSFVAVACGTDGSTDDGGGGAGGAAPTPSDGGAGAADAGAGGAGGGEGGAACAADGTGTLVLEISGLPDGVLADVSTAGAHEYAVTESSSLDRVTTGNYTVTAARVFDEDPIVRTVYDAKVTAPSFCLADGESHTVKITYTAIPSSNKLWMPSGSEVELAGFTSQAIAETGMTDASVAIHTPGSGSVAFDRDGNLWAVGPTAGGDMLVRIPAAELGESGTREPDTTINVPEIECYPFINHIAFDPSGNLWLSACEDQVHRLKAADLTTSGDKTSDVLFTSVVNNSGIAFDNAGNLWVAGGPTLERFDAARLDLSDTDAPDLALSITSATSDKTVLGVDELAFDKAGNLWGISGSFVFELAAADLEGTGEQAVVASHSFTMDVLALPATPAFDDGNALWVSLADGSFGKFSPAQLVVNKGPGAPVTPSVLLTSASITSGLPLAFFPAPEGLPLYHSLPQP
ncbi:MAG: WD40 repeat domain-containing protein [Myxococcales bacterium]